MHYNLQTERSVCLVFPSVELSTDGPMRAPFTAYMQGGLTYAYGRIALSQALQRMVDVGALQLTD